MIRTAHVPHPAALAISMAVIAVLLAACTGGSTGETSTGGGSTGGASPAAEATSSAPEAATVVEVSAVEFSYVVSVTEVPAGTVTFELRNDGGTDHDLVLEGGPGGATATIGPQETDTLTVELEPGTYTLYCSIGNHRAMGMEFEITVT